MLRLQTILRATAATVRQPEVATLGQGLALPFQILMIYEMLDGPGFNFQDKFSAVAAHPWHFEIEE
eukprot:996802-Rhodomonas_salina.1